MKLWTLRSKCEKKRKRKHQLSRESKKAVVHVGVHAVYNPLITSGGYRFLSDGQR